MMEPARHQKLDVCAGCSAVFPRERVQLCPRCITNEHHRFLLVKNYLRDHVRASINEVARVTGLPRSEVGAYLLQGRLIEVDPETGQRRDREVPAELSEAQRQLAEEAARYRERRTLGETAQDSMGPSPGQRPSGPDADDPDDGRVRYVRRKRRSGD